MLNTEQAANVEVLARLRLDALVSGDHEQHEVNPTNSREHVAHEALVAGDIHESEAQALVIGSGQFEMRKPQINRYSTAFFFLEAIGVNAGEGLHQGRFAVVN